MVTTANKKVKGTRGCVIDGIKFKSTLEGYCYNLMKANGFDVEYEPIRIEIHPPFVFQGKKYLAMTYKPDFVCGRIIIECKGWGTDAWQVRRKLIYKKLSEVDCEYYEVSTQKQIRELIPKLNENSRNKRPAWMVAATAA
jgi:hypothetical protein